MTAPNKFEAAGRLVNALRKLEQKRAAKVAKATVRAQVQHDNEREILLAAANPEARALVLAEPGFPVEISCDHCHQGALR